MIPAIEQNFQQREIAEASFRYQAEVERGERVIVGVNRYELEEEQPIEILRIDPALEQKQIERVQARAGVARLGRGRGGARAAEGGRGARGPQPDGADHGRVPRVRDDGRDVRRAARRVGHVARDARFLAQFG